MPKAKRCSFTAKFAAKLSKTDPDAVKLATMNPIAQAQHLQEIRRGGVTVKAISDRIFDDPGVNNTQLVQWWITLLRCTEEEKAQLAAGTLTPTRAINALKKRMR